LEINCGTLAPPPAPHTHHRSRWKYTMQNPPVCFLFLAGFSKLKRKKQK
jgi:hypothetical protein